MEPIPIGDLLWVAAGETLAYQQLGGCLGDLTVARVAGGASATPGDRQHLAGCPACRNRIVTAIMLLRDPTVAVEVGVVRRLHAAPRRRGWVTAGLAAAAILLVFVGQRLVTPPPDSVTRDPAGSATLAPVAMHPIGNVPSGTPFVWTTAPEASAYRISIFDSSGTVVFEEQLIDTVLVIPDTVELEGSRTYLWRIESRTDWDRWTAGPLIEFRVDPTLRAVPAPRSPADDSTGANAPGSARETLPTDNASLDATLRGDTVDPRTVFRALLPTARRDSADLARIAAAYQRTTGDDFLLRELQRFWSWTPTQRAARLATDSIRLAGVEAFGQAGPRAAITIWQRGVALARTARDTTAEAALLGNIGAALARESMVDSARLQLDAARRLSAAVGDWRIVANAVSEVAGLEEQLGAPTRARELYDEAIALRDRTADVRGLASDHNNLALLLRHQGESDQARRHLERARILNRRLNRPAAEATNLINIASLAAASGAVQRAETDLHTGLAILRQLGDSAQLAGGLVSLAELEVQLGAYDAATRSLTAALALFAVTGPLGDELIARQRLVAVLLAKGEIQAGLDAWEELADRRSTPVLGPEIEAQLALGDGDIATALDRPLEAAAAYRRAIVGYRSLVRADGMAAASHGLARLLRSRGDLQQAAALLDSALALQIAQGDPRGAALTRMDRGEVAIEQREFSLARRHLRSADRALSDLGDPVGSAWATVLLARVEAREGRPRSAERLLLRTSQRLAGSQAPDLVWRVALELADLRERRGDRDGARAALRSSLATIEELGVPLRQAADRAPLRGDAAMVYQELALLELAAGDASAAFAASEGMRSREMAAMLSLGSVDARPDTAARLLQREQQLRVQLSVDATTPQARARLASLRHEYAELRDTLRDRVSGYVDVLAPRTAGWQEVAARLAPREAMVEYLITDSTTVAFVIHAGRLETVRMPLTRADLARRIAFARGALGNSESGTWQPALGELHRLLVAPLERHLAGVDRLVIVPHAEMHYLPFAALVEGIDEARRRPRFLVQRYVIELTPSATVWLGRPDAPEPVSGQGTLALAPVPESLPATRAELVAVTSAGDGVSRRIIGPRATEALFRREAGRRRVLHLATLGQLNRTNPLFSFVQLVPGDGHDGRLEVHEIFGLQLTADLVVLSACQTGLGAGRSSDVPPGDEWVGLTRAFLAAGARSVVASLWAVEDQSTARLMEGFYRNSDPAGDPALALAQAQREMLAAGAPHPYHWAGFVTIGGRRHRTGAIHANASVPSVILRQ